jgi:hypothetical protein
MIDHFSVTEYRITIIREIPRQQHAQCLPGFQKTHHPDLPLFFIIIFISHKSSEFPLQSPFAERWGLPFDNEICSHQF